MDIGLFQSASIGPWAKALSLDHIFINSRRTVEMPVFMGSGNFDFITYSLRDKLFLYQLFTLGLETDRLFLGYRKTTYEIFAQPIKSSVLVFREIVHYL